MSAPRYMTRPRAFGEVWDDQTETAREVIIEDDNPGSPASTIITDRKYTA